MCDDNNVIPFTAANIRGVEMCVMTTSFPLGSATNIGGEEMCVMTTTSLLLGEATKQQKRRNVCDDNIIPFKTNNKKHQRNRNAL